MKPIRIQRKRTKGWKMPENTVYVGRPTKWGNPYRVEVFDEWLGKIESIKHAIDLFEKYIKIKVKFGQLDLKELKGKNLACFCREGEPCHADVLLKIANE